MQIERTHPNHDRRARSGRATGCGPSAGCWHFGPWNHGPSYGYAIIAELEANHLGTAKGGTLYPLLSRFEAAGLVAVEWRPGDGGPGRKYFSLTGKGREELDRLRREWSQFTINSTTYLNRT